MAPLFADWVRVKGEVLDVGCGTGALTFVIAKRESVTKIVAIDPSEGFLAYARSKTDDPRIIFEAGDAQKLRFSDASFDQCLALLVIRFIADPPQAAKEMRRVTRPGGTVATAMWDATGGNELNEVLWDAAVSIDAGASREPDKPGSYGTAEELRSLWAGAGLSNIEVRNLAFQCSFDSFDEFWQPLTEDQGPSGTYLRRITEDHRAALREKLRQNLVSNGADRRFALKSKAWAVLGYAP